MPRPRTDHRDHRRLGTVLGGITNRKGERTMRISEIAVGAWTIRVEDVNTWGLTRFYIEIRDDRGFLIDFTLRESLFDRDDWQDVDDQSQFEADETFFVRSWKGFAIESGAIRVILPKEMAETLLATLEKHLQASMEGALLPIRPQQS
jgi:hypothetical protein